MHANGRRSLVAGARAALPLVLAVFPFGIIYGVVTVDLGLSASQSFFFSLLAFAGASQMAAVQLMAENTPLWVVVATALAINLRYFMYSTSIAVHLKGLPMRAKLPLAYLLTDQAYIISISCWAEDDTMHKAWYYTGAALMIWAAWQVGTISGALAGSMIPAALEIDFGVPLVFIGLTVPLLRDRTALLVALVSAGLSLAASSLPCSTGLIVAACGGLALGVWIDQRMQK